MDKWFALPRLGREYFSELMSSRVLYDSGMGFKFTSETDVTRALAALNSALDGGYELESSCFICEKSIEDELPEGAILCNACASSEEAFTLYTMRFVELMSSS